MFFVKRFLMSVLVNICCVVEFFPWFKFYFPLFKILSINHTLPYPKNDGKQNLNQ